MLTPMLKVEDEAQDSSDGWDYAMQSARLISHQPTGEEDTGKSTFNVSTVLIPDLKICSQ